MNVTVIIIINKKFREKNLKSQMKMMTKLHDS